MKNGVSVTSANGSRIAEDARSEGERNVKTNLGSFGLVELEAIGMTGGPRSDASDDEVQLLQMQYDGQPASDSQTGLIITPVTYITTNLPDSLMPSKVPPEYSKASKRRKAESKLCN